MQSTSIFRVGAVALSISALVFVVWTASAPGCTTAAEQVRPEPTSASPSDKAPAAGDTQGKSAAPADTPAAAAVEEAPAPSVVPPRFMGASKAAAPFDEDHMPGTKGGVPKQEPQVAPAQKGGK